MVHIEIYLHNRNCMISSCSCPCPPASVVIIFQLLISIIVHCAVLSFVCTFECNVLNAFYQRAYFQVNISLICFSEGTCWMVLHIDYLHNNSLLAQFLHYYLFYKQDKLQCFQQLSCLSVFLSVFKPLLYCFLIAALHWRICCWPSIFLYS